ncbi:MAG: DUF2892 domain-containing protein [Alphaproteobacteria bacterium]
MPLLTGITGFCRLHALLGIRTCRVPGARRSPGPRPRRRPDSGGGGAIKPP